MSSQRLYKKLNKIFKNCKKNLIKILSSKKFQQRSLFLTFFFRGSQCFNFGQWSLKFPLYISNTLGSISWTAGGCQLLRSDFPLGKQSDHGRQAVSSSAPWRPSFPWKDVFNLVRGIGQRPARHPLASPAGGCDFHAG